MGSIDNECYDRRITKLSFGIRLLQRSIRNRNRLFCLKMVCLLTVAIAVNFPLYGKVPDKASYSYLGEMSINDLKFGVEGKSVMDRSIGLEELLPRVRSEGLSDEMTTLFQAADEGSSEAQYTLYWVYLEGLHVGRDDIQALMWLKKATEQMHPDALHEMALNYYSGGLVEQDYERARLFFEQAAAAGVDVANTNLGIIHEKGLGVVSSISRAKTYFRAAAKRNEPYGANELGRLLLNARKYRAAKKWIQQAVNQNLAHAKYNLGLMKEHGLGMQKDKEAAYLLYQEAADAQVPEAIAANGRIHLLGLKGKVDLDLARQLLMHAYKAGDKSAALSLVAFEPAGDNLWVDGDDVGQVLSDGVIQSDPSATVAMGIRQMLFARNDEDRESGLELIKKVATAGNPAAQHILGKVFDFGLMVPEDFASAARWYRAAAENGVYAAKNRLAYLYYQGRGVEKDLKKFISLLSEVAKTGHQFARYDLAVAYRNGEGVKKDQKLALRKFKELAEEGMPLARYELARIYASYDSGITDKGKARYWLKRLLRVGDISFQIKAADIYSELLGDYETALPFYEKAAESGDPSAINSLGVMYKLGQGVKADWPRAIKLYKQAADMGHPMAMNNYGYAFLVGEGVEQDYHEAFKWIKPAAEKRNPMAQNNMGDYFFNGLGGNIDYKKAREWFEKAVAQKEKNAFHNLGLIYHYGHGVDKDLAKAQALFRKAAFAGHQGAIKRVQAYDDEMRVRTLLNSGELTPYEMWIHANDFLYGQNGRSVNHPLGLELAMKSMAAGYNESYLLVATLYEKGIAVKADSNKAIKYLQDAASNIGSFDAMKRLAANFHKGIGVAKDECLAMNWYREMSLAGGDQGPSIINLLLETSICGNRSRDETMLWLNTLIEQKNPNAVCLFGLLHSIGVGVEKSITQSWELQREAAELGSSACQMRIGVAYATGNGTSRNRGQALHWFKAAAQAGSADAYQNLAYFMVTGPIAERDMVEVYKWYWLSMEKGNYKNRDVLQKLEKRMTHAQIMDAKKRGESWQLANFGLERNY